MKTTLIFLVLMFSSLLYAQNNPQPQDVKKFCETHASECFKLSQATQPEPPTAFVGKPQARTSFGAGTHQATLNWTQSVTSGVTSNNVYQSTTNGGPYTKIFSSAAPIVTYQVTSGLVGNTTYYFVVTAVCSTCNPSESAYSNQVSGTTSADPQPQPPQSLVLTSIN